MINVTQSYLPALDEYVQYLQRAYDKKWLTNRGELVLELEKKICTFLDVQKVLITNNGTTPLQIAIKSLGDTGEIITTPFSYIATCSAILWENFTPVFVDIDPVHLTIDESGIESAITSKTKAILATHVYGNPCNVLEIQGIAQKHGLKVIYDAAHAFGVEFEGRSIFEYGDISTCSFHATKLFHTGEGGAIFCRDETLMDQLYHMHNFGHNGLLEFHGLGINAKISELQAAMGLAVLDHMDEILQKRKAIVDLYDKLLDNELITGLQIRKDTKWNYHYYPVIFNSEEQLLEVEKVLNAENIFPRRYFYPSLNTVKFINGKSMPVAEDISKRILCLPIYPGLDHSSVESISVLINQCVMDSVMKII